MKILVLQLGGIGDAVMSLPALGALRSAYEDSTVDVAFVQKAPASFLPREFCDRSFVVPYDLRQLRSMVQAALGLRREGYDLCFVPTGAHPLKAGLFAWLAGAKARVGDRRKGMPAFFYTHSVPLDTGLHITESNEQILSLIGIAVKEKMPSLGPSLEAAQKASEFFVSHRLQSHVVLGLHLGSAWAGGSRRWPLPHVEALVAHLRERMPDVRIVIFGAPNEQDFCQTAAERMGDTVSLAVGQPIGESMALMSRCAAFLGSDGGLVHLAAALGVPTVALFGPVDPKRNAPKGEEVHIIQEKCSHMRRAPQNPWEGPHTCMSRITPERVYAVVAPLLSESETVS